MYHPTLSAALALFLCICTAESRISYVRVADQEHGAAPRHQPLEGFDIHADSDVMRAMREYFDMSSYSMSLSMPVRTKAPIAAPVAVSMAPVAAPVATTAPASAITSPPTTTELPSAGAILSPTVAPSLRVPPPKVEDGPDGERGDALLSRGGRVALITTGTGVVCATALVGLIVWGRRQSA